MERIFACSGVMEFSKGIDSGTGELPIPGEPIILLQSLQMETQG